MSHKDNVRDTIDPSASIVFILAVEKDHGLSGQDFYVTVKLLQNRDPKNYLL